MAGLVAPSKVVAVALNTSLIPDEDEARRLIEATAAETGLLVADPVRFGGDAMWREIETAVDALPWVVPAETGGRVVTLALRLRTLQLPLRDPFVIARAQPGEGRLDHDRRGGAARRGRRPGRAGRPGRGIPGRVLRGHARDDGAPWPRCSSTRSSVIEADLRGTVDDVRAALEDAEGLMSAAIGHHGAIKCAIDIALHDLAGKRLGLPVRELIGLPGTIPPTDFTLGIDAPAVVAERARRAADFPALKIKVGGPSDIETLEAVRARVRGPDPRGRQHGLDARGRPGAAAGARAPGRRADRAAVPGAAAGPAALRCRNAPRCRSSRTRAPSRSRTWTRSWASWRAST